MLDSRVDALLDDSAEYIITRQGGKKKKYNTEKVWIYETTWMYKNDPRLNSDNVEVLIKDDSSDNVIVRVRTRLAVKATQMAQTVPSGPVVVQDPVLYTTKPVHKRRLANNSGTVRHYNRNRNWQ